MLKKISLFFVICTLFAISVRAVAEPIEEDFDDLKYKETLSSIKEGIPVKTAVYDAGRHDYTVDIYSFKTPKLARMFLLELGWTKTKKLHN
ncbi:hypothetical protein KY343_04065, partial [Candidatus Woesearchaeota archaeon]|nr:hypothetical protein [Candidatus Woesearchaeota archaeon]